MIETFIMYIIRDVANAVAGFAILIVIGVVVCVIMALVAIFHKVVAIFQPPVKDPTTIGPGVHPDVVGHPQQKLQQRR
jgi:cell division protein FtsN